MVILFCPSLSLSCTLLCLGRHNLLLQIWSLLLQIWSSLSWFPLPDAFTILSKASACFRLTTFVPSSTTRGFRAQHLESAPTTCGIRARFVRCRPSSVVADFRLYLASGGPLERAEQRRFDIVTATVTFEQTGKDPIYREFSATSLRHAEERVLELSLE
jgi:hypothetical protein